MVCPSCSAPLPEGARFCPACGQVVQTPSDERRIVTVLFGDLVGFTSMAETRDPEQVKNLVDRCFERLAADITAHGGRVDKIVGDAVVALFGAPIAHEDDAERAVRAALQMQRTLGSEAAAIGSDVEMRIGVNTGEVLVGAVRAGGDYTAMGDVVNTASRLQTIAGPGHVVVGPDTYRATRDVVRYQPLGPVEARGREEHVEAWIALEAVAQPGRRPRRSPAPLVGRDAEMSLLCSAMESAVLHRRPWLALLLGDAGMGKSRLVEEVAATAAGRHDALVLEGHGVPYGEANVWWPLAETVREAWSLDADAAADDARAQGIEAVAEAVGLAPDSADVERTVDALLYLMGFEGPLSDVDPARARDEVARAVRTWLEGVAARRPVVLSISDVQWADQLVLDLVEDLVQRAQRLPLVVLLTARPDVAVWRPAPGRHNSLVLTLDPLGRDAAAELLGRLLGDGVPADVIDALLDRSGGNPFFLEELAALLSESGGVADVADLPSLPATLRGLVAARLDALPATERSLLEDAAVLGRRGPLTALQELAATRGTTDIGGALDALAVKDLLAIDDGQCRFRSDLVREVAYGILTKAERARRHATLAGWLEGQASEKERTDELLEELARHHAAAAEVVAELGRVEGTPPDVQDRAIEALERAAERSEDRETHLVSLRLYDQMLRLLEGGDDPRLLHALVGRARALTAMRRHEEARVDLMRVMDGARAAGDDVALARALTVKGELERHESSFAASQATLEEALALWQRIGDRRGEAAALRRLGLTALIGGDKAEAEAAFLEALEAFQDIGSRKGVAWANQNLAWISFVRGEAAAAEERLMAAGELFGDIGDWGGLGWARGLLAYVQFSQGRMDDAEALALRVLDDSSETGDVWGNAMMRVLVSMVRLWRGQTDDAVALAGEARTTMGRMGDLYGEARAIAPYSRGLLMQGHAAEAAAAVADMKAMAESFLSEDERGFAAVLAGGLCVHAGEPERALAALDGVDVGLGEDERAVIQGLALAQTGRPEEGLAKLERAAERGLPGPRAAALGALALAAAAAGERTRVREATDDLDRLADQAVGTYLDRTMAAMAMSCAAAAAGDAAEARAWLTRATETAGATGDRLTSSIVQLARGRVLEALGDPDGAAAALSAAGDRLSDAGVDGHGWDTLFRLATGIAATAA